MTEYVLRPVDREREWQKVLASMGGYLFDVRVGGGPDMFTAWTVKRDDLVDVPFIQATGPTLQQALRNLADRLDDYDLFAIDKPIAAFAPPTKQEED